MNVRIKDSLKRVLKLDDQPIGVIYLHSDSQFGADTTETVRKTEYCVEQDDTGAANYYTVVHAGQLFYLRSLSGEDIKIEFKAGMFVDPNTGVATVSPIVVPGDGKPVEVRIEPNANENDTTFLRAQGAGNGHGSPTLIIRRPPVGSS